MRNDLHYVFDPLCGWCYAAGPLVRTVVAELGGCVRIQLHPGLMFATPHDINATGRARIIAADQRIAELSGAVFGASYLERIRTAQRLCYDSRLASAAVMAAASVGTKLGLHMLADIQRLHYVHGEDVSDPISLRRIAVSLGLDAMSFDRAIDDASEQLATLSDAARALMYEMGSNAFPTFVLDLRERRVLLTHGDVYRRPDVFVARITRLLETD